MPAPGMLSPRLVGSAPRADLHLTNDVPDGVTRRARSFVGTHGVRVGVRTVEDLRQ
ncbi:hypothetical protein SUDANB180_07495 [Streptomyces sp. enrichment culture]